MNIASQGGHPAQPSAGAEHGRTPEKTTGGEDAIDPVCAMTVDPHKTPHRHVHQHHTYYFCSAGCRSKFAAEPAKYLAEQAAVATPPPGTIYTCPMHPQIRQVGPGHCPICGMALEPARRDGRRAAPIPNSST